ncbi:uncharacterized protein TRUGW13939_04713 [Talaromyces rugulosus]|uniref:C2H2-type domain-containing protein n=1 Tax=Talaromyces rugulosus TaxID=121627 RepID=A0A7H8QVR6_TALRU|nr:uncharacterized protein TRUGW13939_04713 [Talaromyces rugulosus]QKX57595.1 hypothetical protein TRUGW13939_04713 [Talaromyces rugulosus]
MSQNLLTTPKLIIIAVTVIANLSPSYHCSNISQAKTTTPATETRSRKSKSAAKNVVSLLQTRSKSRTIEHPCKKRFKGLSGLIGHLEHGRCASGITRQKINSLILKHNIDGLIIDIPASDSAPSDTEDGSSTTWDAIATPGTGSTFSVDPEEWDGRGAIVAASPRSSISYTISEEAATPTPDIGADVSSTDVTTLVTVCALSNGRPFTSRSALQDHISSTVHEKRIFHCPKSLDSGKRGAKTGSFATLSALLSHLEAGVCQGGIDTFCETVKYLNMTLRDIGLEEELLKQYYNL